ncbi:NmrA-like family protein [Penicillium bovifimosum]|uniref:NmrA-like family protein n=1 Tax=Penicillium bovifimosum TaxID=126998 RepID=A0A9W9HD44_9EURO|nr:NmrA-like family protein [Penicillium bovifimosum]KAJ5143466.1 NmrA-like family protein [Penicillium bovifimosum]
MKARILIAYLASEQLIIQKTPLLDFADETAAVVNTTLFMRYMASKATGDTKGIEISTDPPRRRNLHPDGNGNWSSGLSTL